MLKTKTQPQLTAMYYFIFSLVSAGKTSNHHSLDEASFSVIISLRSIVSLNYKSDKFLWKKVIIDFIAIVFWKMDRIMIKAVSLPKKTGLYLNFNQKTLFKLCMGNI